MRVLLPKNATISSGQQLVHLVLLHFDLSAAGWRNSRVKSRYIRRERLERFCLRQIHQVPMPEARSKMWYMLPYQCPHRSPLREVCKGEGEGGSGFLSTMAGSAHKIHRHAKRRCTANASTVLYMAQSSNNHSVLCIHSMIFLQAGHTVAFFKVQLLVTKLVVLVPCLTTLILPPIPSWHMITELMVNHCI